MALAAAGQVYLWTKPSGPPPPPSGNALYFRYVSHLYCFMLLILRSIG